MNGETVPLLEIEGLLSPGCSRTFHVQEQCIPRILREQWMPSSRMSPCWRASGPFRVWGTFHPEPAEILLRSPDHAIALEDLALVLETEERPHGASPEGEREQLRRMSSYEQRVMTEHRRDMAQFHPSLSLPPHELDLPSR